MANWRFKQFPHTVDERAAQLEHVATRVFHNTIPPLTKALLDERWESPATFGYTRIPSSYAQLIEKFYGRPPRYDVSADEYQEFKENQIEMTNILYLLGVEQVGQMHRNNPFAYANQWKNPDSGHPIWLDGIPAMRHSMGYIFGFHDEIQDYFEANTPTFNRIHTDIFQKMVERHKSAFDPATFKAIIEDLQLYEEVRTDFEATYKGKNDFVSIFTALDALTEQIVEGSPVYKLLYDSNFRKSVTDTMVKIFADPEFRTHYLYKKTVMRGVEKAKELGIISDDEYNASWQRVENDDLNHESRKRNLAYIKLEASYLAIGWMCDIAAGIVGMNAAKDVVHKVLEHGAISPQELVQGIAALIIWRGLPALLNPIATDKIAKHDCVNLNVAKHISALPIPLMTTYLAIPAQMSAGNDDTILHYQLRNMFAKLPGVEWGNEIEALVWKTVGEKLQQRLKG